MGSKEKEGQFEVCESETMPRMHLIGALQEHLHSLTSKTRPRSRVKSSASAPQSALQFIHYADTPDLIY